jgi:hypothetical protein
MFQGLLCSAVLALVRGLERINLLKTTGYVIHAHTVFMGLAFISEQTATSAPYDIN